MQPGNKQQVDSNLWDLRVSTGFLFLSKIDQGTCQHLRIWQEQSLVLTQEVILGGFIVEVCGQ